MKIKKLFTTILIFIFSILIINSISLASNDIIVALDPGHGGTDSGAVGGNLKESDLNWKIASRVKEILDETPGITGILTKSKDETLDSTNDRKIRATRAVENGADLLVSFHINSNESSNSLSGAEVHITSYTAEKRFYEYSNRLGLDILSNLRSVGVQSHSLKPITKIGADWDRYPDGSVADYYGIISWPVHMGIPGMIIEHAFINNPYDRVNYLNDTMLNKMAEADANAIIKNKELFRREFYGKINTELIDLNYMVANGNQDYIQGYIYIAEWVGNDCRTPVGTPKLTLKSTDGTFSTDLYVGYEDGIRYYFDKNISGLDLNKEYYIEAKLTSSKNLETEANKTQRVALTNKTLKENYKGRTFKVVNNKLVFSSGKYEGKIDAKLNEIKLSEKNDGTTYLAGNIDISEVLETGKRTPLAVPEIRMKSTDGKVNEIITLKYEGESNYAFEKNIDNINRTKTYYLEANLTSEDNIAKAEDKKQKLELGTKEIGKLNGFTVKANNNNLVITYYGTINTELIEMNIIQNASGDNYISGHINIAEWVDGKSKTPTTTPKMTLKSTDGKVVEDIYINHENGIKYYYDRNIQKLDISKEYYIEVELTDKTNTATTNEKTQIAKFLINKVNGKLTDGRRVQIVNNNHLKIIDETLYYGTINTELYNIKVIQNGTGANYISGNIYIAEWVGKNCRTPQGTPKMTLKSTDGKTSLEMYVAHESGIGYYFDRNIEGIDTSKEYYIEVKLQGKKNIAEEASKTQRAKITKQGKIGTCTNGNKVTVSGNTIKVTADTYKGTINTELYNIKVIQNGTGANYISGNIYIAEWVGKNCRTPQGTPKMTLKSTDGKTSLEMYVAHESGIGYYFDRNIEGIDISKEYYIEVKLQGKKNIAEEASKTQRAKITKQGKIGTCTNGNKVTVSGNTIKVTADTYKGTINTELYNINLIQNGAGANYISGNIYIAEWVGNDCRTPQGTPKMTFKSTDGKTSLEMYVAYESGIGYYFDRNIEGIDISKEYYIEVKLQGKNNIAEEASKTQEAKITKNGKIGTCTNGNKVTVSKNHIKIEKSVKAKTMTKTIEEKQEPKREKENKTNENLMVNKDCEN